MANGLEQADRTPHRTVASAASKARLEFQEPHMPAPAQVLQPTQHSHEVRPSSSGLVIPITWEAPPWPQASSARRAYRGDPVSSPVWSDANHFRPVQNIPVQLLPNWRAPPPAVAPHVTQACEACSVPVQKSQELQRPPESSMLRSSLSGATQAAGLPHCSCPRLSTGDYIAKIGGA